MRGGQEGIISGHEGNSRYERMERLILRRRQKVNDIKAKNIWKSKAEEYKGCEGTCDTKKEGSDGNVIPARRRTGNYRHN